MKILTKVISPLGTFESDLKEVDITREPKNQVYEQSHNLNCLAVQ